MLCHHTQNINEEMEAEGLNEFLAPQIRSCSAQTYLPVSLKPKPRTTMGAILKGNSVTKASLNKEPVTGTRIC